MSTSYVSDFARIRRYEIEWNKTRIDAASMLAVGFPKTEVAERIGVDRQTIYNWLEDPEFAAEVDRLSLMTGVASRAERMRLVNQLVRQKIKEDGTIITEKDILDWLKFAQSETTGAKLDFSKLAELLTGESEAIDITPNHQPSLSEPAEPLDIQPIVPTTDDNHNP